MIRATLIQFLKGAMSNLTLAIDDELLRDARIKALQNGTSVNEICRRAIEQFVGRESAGERQATALRATFAFAKPRHAGSGPLWEGRDVLYEDRVPPEPGSARSKHRE